MTLVVVAEGIGVLARYPRVPRLGPTIAFDGLFGLALIAANEGIGVQEAIEVAGLVLQAAGEETLAFDGDVVAVFVLAGHARPVGAAGGKALARNGEAALVIGAVIGRHGLWNLGGL